MQKWMRNDDFALPQGSQPVVRCVEVEGARLPLRQEEAEGWLAGAPCAMIAAPPYLLGIAAPYNCGAGC